MSKKVLDKKEKILSLREYLDDLAKKGPVTVEWSGGNDSGGYQLYVGNKEMPYTDEVERVFDKFEEVLGYGSWAGEYAATGLADYDPETGIFSGTNKMRGDEWKSIDCDIKIEVSDKIWWETMTFNLDDCRAEVEFSIRNGMVCPFWRDESGRIMNELQPQIDNVLASCDDDIHTTSMWRNLSKRFDFVEEDGKYIYHLKELDYCTIDWEARDVNIDVND